MGSAERRQHWDLAYADRGPAGVSWFEPVPERSLDLVAAAGLGPADPILDAGGGASGLAAELLERGHRDITVTDISAAALEQARAGLGERASEVNWLVADIRNDDLGRRFALWHDRAVFHFMVDPGDRSAYLANLRRGLRPGGHLVMATFGPDGPTRCSGLPVQRYGRDELEATLGDDFEPLAHSIELHTTPSGNQQQLLYVLLRRTAS